MSNPLPRKSWNAQKNIGPKTEFTASQLRVLEVLLIRDQNWHDLALLSTALDTMLRASDLLKLRTTDVTFATGRIRNELRLKQQKTDGAVSPILTNVTQAHLGKWLQVSGKRLGQFIFTRGKDGDGPPISRGHYATLIKDWASWLGLPSDAYSTHSLRRSMPVILYDKGVPVELIADLLGHRSVASTKLYLGINQKKAAAALRKYAVLKGPPKS